MKRLKFVFVLLNVAICASALAQNDPNTFFQEGKNYFAKGEHNLALDAFNQAILMNRNFSRAYTERAKVKIALHRFDEAYLDHNKALEINSEFATYEDYAQLTTMKEDIKGFVFFYNDCISSAAFKKDTLFIDSKVCLDDKYMDSSHYQGHAFVKYISGDVIGAEADALDLLQNDKSNIYANYLLGVIAEKNSKFNEAISYFTKAISLDSTFYLNYYRRAVVFKKMQNFESAIKDLYKAEKLHKTNELVYYNRAVIYLSQENWSKSLRDLNKALKLNASFAEAYFNRGYVKRQLKDFVGAIEDFNMYLRLKPKDINVYINRGNLYMLTSEYLMAQEDYNHAIQLDQHLSVAYLNRGNSHIILGNNAQGCQDFNKAIELGSKYANQKKRLYCD